MSDGFPVPFDVRLEPHRERLLVVPVGELDLHSAHRLREAMQEQFAIGFRRVVADLRELQFIDSSGIRVLWQMHREAESDGMQLSVIPGSGEVLQALAITGLLERMHLTE
jgi:anti-sigma B factor antagonist